MSDRKEKALFCYTNATRGDLIVKWLVEQAYEVVGLVVDVGGHADISRVSKELKEMGCNQVIIEDMRCSFITEFVYPAVQAKCALGVPLSAPCVAKMQMQVAAREGISTVVHGVRGDVQIQFELVYYALQPQITVITPWRDSAFVAAAETQGVPVSPSAEHHYDGITDLDLQYLNDVDSGTPTPDLEPETISIEFKNGIPVKIISLTGTHEGTIHTNPLDIFSFLNEIGTEHGVGIIDRIEDFELTVKGKITVASPGHTILAVAHTDIEGITMDREVRRLRDMLQSKFTALVKGGCRFSPEMDFITAAINKSQEFIDGIVTLQVCAGNVFPTSRTSEKSLFDKELSSMSISDAVDPQDVEGFIKVHSMRLSAHHAILTKHSPKDPSRWPAGTLTMSDGSSFEGRVFGQQISTAGEVVFTTGMVGYPESLTDPSYRGQILVLTYPMIGNYGIPPMTKDSYGIMEHFESFGAEIHVAGLIVSEYCEEPSHWNASSNLSQWLKSQNIPAMMMVDTRALVKKIRESGSLLGKITCNYDVEFKNPNLVSLTKEVSLKRPITYGNGDLTILCIDMGVKLNTIRLFLKHNVTLKVVPWDWDIRNEEYDGLFISNGPGDPSLLQATIDNLKWAIQRDTPIFGICMGNLVLGLAAGATSYKLKYGNRGQNQPVINHMTKKCIITTQNHGYAIDNNTLPDDWEVYFTNANDKSNEGIKHKTKPFFSVQFHPEARCGPNDSEYLFTDFIDNVRDYKIECYILNKPRKVLVLGAGGITIGQAGEFDYSGSQCIKSIKEEGIETVLINPNVATVQTAVGLADHIYYTPITVPYVEDVIKKEKPDGIMLGFGGQTALNCGLQLQKQGILRKYNVRVLGTPTKAIEISEDREMFAETLKQIHEKLAPSQAVSSIEEAVAAAATIKYPVMVRAAFALGGLGSGIVNNEEELRTLVAKALANSPQVLVEKSVKGWKEVEYEVVRDVRDNCITVCNMENFDPMGVHTGESIVVAPSQTLTNDEYHMLRTASIKIIRHLGIVGECNVQYGLDPESMEYIVIEVNARLSRSSALASKATGYPLAAVAAKLALGIELPDVINSVTKGTTACFEPSLDYVVVKMPRWDLSKFNMVSQKIGSVMKSVGEVMAIGRSFQEAFQKAVRMADLSYKGFDDRHLSTTDLEHLEEEIRNPTPLRVFHIAKALKLGATVSDIHTWSNIDIWFLEKLKDISMLGTFIEEEYGCKLTSIPATTMWELKAMGYSDIQIAERVGSTEKLVRERRKSLDVLPFVKQIDTVAGEFPADTNANYLYLTYNASFDDIKPSDNPVAVLGSGVYRIGSSVEFDYCGVMCLRNLHSLGHKTVMINSNPETVSTDYDESDRLYFEELSLERILDICDKETPSGVVVSVGGQISQNLAMPLQLSSVNVLGTDPLMIDQAEDRSKFSTLCDEIGVDQPRWSSLTSVSEAAAFCSQIGYPVLLRPSYVLSGSAMNVVWREEDLSTLLEEAAAVSTEHPVVISKYHTDSMELDVDVVADQGTLVTWAVSQHLENAGVHSGDATMVLPPLLKSEDVETVRQATERLAAKLRVSGPMNVQYLRLPDGSVKVIEANVRCSRSVPFVSKTTGVDFCRKMVEVLTRPFVSGTVVEAIDMVAMRRGHMGVKAPMFSFLRLTGADPILGVEMSSTGEVACFGHDFDEVFLKAMLCAGFRMPKRNVYVNIESADLHDEFFPSVVALAKCYELFASPETAKYLMSKGVSSTVLANPRDRASSHTSYLEAIERRILHMVVNLRDPCLDWQLKAATPETVQDGYLIRRNAIDFNVPLLTNLQIATHVARVITKPCGLDISSYNSYFA
eukprot:TRINITY_DN5103_c0_g1_i1.p1 TRINITY_DN5103_c0_g1~~TRINITY_DN5103_c0_g1_i1.p1  ORF type:complete len:1852 (+),score=476.78 TRINITY_DN5103_c0_g1_i1:65-5557(+)